MKYTEVACHLPGGIQPCGIHHRSVLGKQNLCWCKCFEAVTCLECVRVCACSSCPVESKVFVASTPQTQRVFVPNVMPHFDSCLLSNIQISNQQRMSLQSDAVTYKNKRCISFLDRPDHDSVQHMHGRGPYIFLFNLKEMHLFCQGRKQIFIIGFISVKAKRQV